MLKKSKNMEEVNFSCTKIDQSFEESSSNKICDKQESSERESQLDSYVKNREKVSFVGMKPLQVDEIFQPRKSAFPSRNFGEEVRHFKGTWFENKNWNSWLHHDITSDSAFCYTCIKAIEKNMISNKNAEKAFISERYRNWEDAATKNQGFDKHLSSGTHREANERLYLIPQMVEDVGEIILSCHADEKSANRQCLLKILSNVTFLARQSLPLRGTGDDCDSNFSQLYLLHEEGNPILKAWRTKKKTNKYVHHEIQNKMMEVKALKILREIAYNVREADFYSIMCDEATDVAIVSQLLVCLRWVDDELNAHDEFIGLKDMSATGTNAESIVRELKDCLLRVDLKLTKCRGQCYYGCSTMKGPKNGVVVQIKKEQQRKLYSHCYAHSLNLAVGDTMKSSNVLQDTIDTTFELTKLIKFSPERDAVLRKLQSRINNEDAFEDFVKPPRVTLFCPTRWTVRADCLNAVIENYDQLQELWERSLQNSNDTKTKARICGVSAHTKTFAFCVGIHISHFILGHSDNLSRALQSAKLSANEAQEMARCTVMVLRSLRTEDNFKLFYETVTNFAEQHDAGQASLPRKRKAPSKIIFGKAPQENPETPADDYQVKFF